MNEIKAKWKQKDGFQQYPPTFGTRTISLLGRITSYGIPISVVLAWLLLLFGLIAATSPLRATNHNLDSATPHTQFKGGTA